MLTRTVALPGPLVVLPTDSAEGEISRLHRTRPRLPGCVEDLMAEFGAHAEVSAVLNEHRGRRGLVLYGRDVVAVLVPDAGTGTAPARCYRMVTVRLLGVKDRHTLDQGCLLLRPTAWTTRYAPGAVPDGSESHWETLTGQWELLRKDMAGAKGGSEPGRREGRLLDDLHRVVDKELEIQRDRARAVGPYAYRAAHPAAERRLTGRSVYTFALRGRQAPGPDEVVQVRGEPGLRGTVVAVDPQEHVTVAFDRVVDWAQLPQQGELERVANGTAHTRRTEALAALRDGTARNPRLLSVLAGTRSPRTNRTRGNPPEGLDDWQRAAFSTALATEDLSVVIGPPGTGKTRVITEVVRAVTREGGRSGRVLVTAHSNAAVDNVLGRLGEDLLIVRVGHEGRVSEEARPYLLHTRAAALRQGILDRVGNRLRHHDGGRAAQWTRALDDALDRLESAMRAEEAARAARRTAIRAVDRPAQRRVDRLEARLTKARARQERVARRHAARAERLDRWRSAERRTPAGRLRLWWWARLLTRATAVSEARRAATAHAELAWREAEEALGGQHGGHHHQQRRHGGRRRQTHPAHRDPRDP
ncbi:AAA domain-containing protein, partial [Streptomyces sp. NPDC003832]